MQREQQQKLLEPLSHREPSIYTTSAPIVSMGLRHDQFTQDCTWPSKQLETKAILKLKLRVFKNRILHPKLFTLSFFPHDELHEYSLMAQTLLRATWQYADSSGRTHWKLGVPKNQSRHYKVNTELSTLGGGCSTLSYLLQIHLWPFFTSPPLVQRWGPALSNQ